MGRFSLGETGSRLISSVVDYYTRPPEPPVNNASDSLKFRPARAVTKARFKNDMAFGDERIEEGMKLLASNERYVSRKEMDVLLLSRDKISKRKIAIMEACDARFISPKVHISPFIYNSKAAQWYRQIEKLVDRHELQTLPSEEGDFPEGSNAANPNHSSHESQRSAAWSLLSSLSQRYTTFASASSGSRRAGTNNALGLEGLVSHPFDGQGYWTPDVPMIIEPEETENLSEWVDECLTHIDDSEAGLKLFLREVCLQEEAIDNDMMENIENIMRHTSRLDPIQFTHELARRRNELNVRLSRVSSTECPPSGTSSATLPPDDVIAKDKNPDHDPAGLLLEPFGQLRLSSDTEASTSSQLAPPVEAKDSRGRSRTL